MCSYCYGSKARIINNSLRIDSGETTEAHFQAAAAGLATRWSDFAGDLGTDLAISPFDRFDATSLTRDFSGAEALVLRAPAPKYETALLDGAFGTPGPTALLMVTTTDNVPDTITGTNPEVTVDGAHVISTIDTIGDQDFFKVQLTAGTVYEIGQYGYTGGPGGVPLSDAYIEIYDADGNKLVEEDGGGETPGGQIYGLDALLVFVPETSGTYYINARAFDSDPGNGESGDSVGDYELFVRIQVPDPDAYVPYYSHTSPLYSIDWGTQVNKVNQSVRNPDGNEGIRETGNAQGTPTYNVNNVAGFDMAAILAANNMTSADITGKNVITIYFAKAGDVFASNNPADPGLPPATITAVGVQAFEYNAVWTSLREFAKVADIVYLEVQDQTHADFIYTSYQGTPGPGVSLLGSMSPPDESDEGLAQFNSGDYRWNATDLQQGGFSFVTLIHEFGHGHGLAHPHDTGGHSGVMRGVDGTINTPAGQVPDPTGVYPNYTNGDFDLNQQVFTMMSYQDGWPKSPYGNAPTNVGYGYLGGLSPFDIAAIQDKYGVNEEYASGNDIYTLKDVNAAGTYYSSIWDVGGTDQIVYTGERDALIDLRAATLKYEWGGGGNVSYAFGIYGGFTIANGVVIENAKTDAGDDLLIDNAANNRLESGAGNDIVAAHGGGDDIVVAGSGDDFLFFGAELGAGDLINGRDGFDNVTTLGGFTVVLGADTFTSIEKMEFYSGTLAAVPAPGNVSVTMHDGNVVAGQQFIVYGGSLTATEQLFFDGSAETDGSFFLRGGSGNDTLIGSANADRILGRGGDDRITGGLGGDSIDGMLGNDVLVITAAADSTGGGFDRLEKFHSGFDKIDLPTAVTGWTGSVGGDLRGASFDADLAAAVDGALQANSAVLFTATGGDFANRVFAVVDANGDGAYQAGTDYVFEFVNPIEPVHGSAIFV